MVHTITVHMSIRAGKAMSVAVRPKRWMTIPVPKSENRNEIEFVVYKQEIKKEQKYG